MMGLFNYFEQSAATPVRGITANAADKSEVEEVYKRYHGLMTVYCGAVPQPSSNRRRGYFTMQHEPVSFMVNRQQPLMEIELRSGQIPLPKGWTRDGEIPLIIPDDIDMSFNVSLRKFEDLFLFRKAHYRLRPQEILWDVGNREPFAANTPVSSIDCQKMHLLADIFERTQSPRRLPDNH